jgi:hypothetical protein
MKITNKLFFGFVFVLFFIVLGSFQEARAQSGSMEWWGSVDDRVNVVIRGRNATTNTVSGQMTTDDRSRFNGRLPRDRSNVRVEKGDGRGNVFVLQQPNRRNNWTAIIRVVDNKGGRDRYRFTVYWD